MPRSKRQEVQRRHDQILDALEKALLYLTELHEMFAPHHPQNAKGYESIIYMVAQAHEFVKELKDFG